ncbi:MAG TPA: hypothetical protein VHS56_10850 [Candidatus Cybelea sp.]|nr:hypothetical protein [Candidatus Cybelea sp.]
MNLPASSRYAIVFCTASLIFTGCGGSQAQIGAPTVPQSDVKSTHPGHADSGVAHRATDRTSWTVSGRTILLNGEPFYIKGVDYGNTQVDSYPDPNPLDNANEAIWKPDLDAMCAAGVNAVKVYNVSLDSFKPYLPDLGDGNKLKPYEKGKIDKFLDHAWSGCPGHPIYVVLSIFFGGNDVLNPAKLKALKAVYDLTSKEYASYPAVMGFSIGSEINSLDLIDQPVWWKGLNEINDAIRLGYRPSRSKKIITTTMVDLVTKGELATLVQGEKNDFSIDAWGIDSYRGFTFTNIWKQIEMATKKPEIMAEYGASAGWWTQSTATYDQTSHLCPQNTYPTGSFPPPDWPKDKPWSGAPYWGLPPNQNGQPPWNHVRELPATGNPSIQFLADQVTSNAEELYTNSVSQGGVGSGGFYFEWNDEWAKAGWPHLQIGGASNGNGAQNIAPTPPFAGCYWDEAWFGLNADKPVNREYKFPGEGNPFPLRPPDKRVHRATLDAIKAVWAKEL